MDDSWEVLNFESPGVIDGDEDSDGDGITDFFEFIYGSDPNDSESLGSPFRVTEDPTTGEALFTWAVPEEISLGTHYLIEVSTDLVTWATIPPTAYTLEQNTIDGTTSLALTLSHNYGSCVFLRLKRP